MDRFQAAVGLKDRGFDHASAGRPRAAITAFNRCLALIDAPTDQRSAGLAVRALVGLATATADISTVSAGLAFIERARQQSVDAADLSLGAVIEAQHGFVLLRAGRSAEALQHLDVAAAQLGVFDVKNRASVLLTRGLVHLDHADVEAARADFKRCIGLAGLTDVAEGPALVFKARCNLGWAAFLAGDLPAALQAMSDAAGMDADVERGILTMDRARVLIEAGLVRQADALLGQVVEEFSRLRSSQDRGEAELARAECALLLGDTVSAERFGRRAAVRFGRRGSERWALQARLCALIARAEHSHTAAVVAEAFTLRAALTDQGRAADSAAATLLAAEQVVGQGDVANARELVASAGRHDRIGLRVQRSLVTAKIAVAQGSAVTARRQVRRGLTDIARHQSLLGGLDLRTAAALHGQRLFNLHLRLALQDGRPQVVFDAAEDVRAISSRLPFVRAPADPRAAALVGELRALVESLRAPGVVATPAQLGRRGELETDIAALSWQQPGSRDLGRPARYARVRAALIEAGSDMVAYIRVGGQAHAVVAGSGRGRVVAIGATDDVRELVRRIRADLDLLAQRALPRGIRDSVAGSLRTSLSALDELIVAPLGVGRRPLTVVAGGVAALVPWGMLPSLAGLPVTVTLSATWWVSAPAGLPDRPVVSALAGPDLARGDDEVQHVAATWKGSTEPGTAAGLKDALCRADLVHVAAHGRHEAQNPMFSSLRMSDGPYFAHEIPQLEQVPRHVVLSACELGVATIRPGDEPLGLTSVLLHAGVRSVVAGVARVSDDTAAETMVAYHQLISAGTDPGQALASVAQSMSAPVPFVLFGRGSA